MHSVSEITRSYHYSNTERTETSALTVRSKHNCTFNSNNHICQLVEVLTLLFELKNGKKRNQF